MKACSKKVDRCVTKLIRIVAKINELSKCMNKCFNTDKIDNIYELDDEK